MAKAGVHSIAFKRQVVQGYLAGETLHGLARRHDLSRNPVRIWVDDHEARIAALERLVGKQALELELPNGLRPDRRRVNPSTRLCPPATAARSGPGSDGRSPPAGSRAAPR